MSDTHSTIFDKFSMRRAANRMADQYDAAAVLPHEIVDRLLEHMQVMRIDPTVILDVGARTGYSSLGLQRQYPEALVYSVDSAEKMLLKQNKNSVCADIEELPFPDQVANIIFSNLQLHAINNFAKTFLDFRRILKPGGLLIFSLFGPDTLKELRHCFQDQYPHVYSFVDMHDIGDALVSCGFSDPVMEMEKITLLYKTVDDVMLDLKKCVWQNSATSRSKSLMGKEKFQNMKNAYRQFISDEKYPASFEVIYGHAWIPEEKSLSGLNKQGEAIIPISSIKKKGER